MYRNEKWKEIFCIVHNSLPKKGKEAFHNGGKRRRTVIEFALKRVLIDHVEERNGKMAGRIGRLAEKGRE